MTTFMGRAERPAGRDSRFMFVAIEATDHPEGGARRGAATLTLTWGQGPEEQGREEYTRLGAQVEDAIDLVRDAALSEQKGESRRYIEMAASRAVKSVLEERELWRRAGEVAEALMRGWSENGPPVTRAKLKEAVRAAVSTDRDAAAVMEIVGRLLAAMASDGPTKEVS
jgi:hypothetical protein